MDVPGHITFGAGRSGRFQFGMVQGQMDVAVAAEEQRVDFTGDGFDEGTELRGAVAPESWVASCKGTYTFMWVTTQRSTPCASLHLRTDERSPDERITVLRIRDHRPTAHPR